MTEFPVKRTESKLVKARPYSDSSVQDSRSAEIVGTEDSEEQFEDEFIFLHNDGGLQSMPSKHSSESINERSVSRFQPRSSVSHDNAMLSEGFEIPNNGLVLDPWDPFELGSEFWAFESLESWSEPSSTIDGAGTRMLHLHEDLDD